MSAVCAPSAGTCPLSSWSVRVPAASEGGTVAASETAVAAGVGTAYVQQQYVDGSAADSSLYTATTNGQM